MCVPITVITLKANLKCTCMIRLSLSPASSWTKDAPVQHCLQLLRRQHALESLVLYKVIDWLTYYFSWVLLLLMLMLLLLTTTAAAAAVSFVFLDAVDWVTRRTSALYKIPLKSSLKIPCWAIFQWSIWRNHTKVFSVPHSDLMPSLGMIVRNSRLTFLQLKTRMMGLSDGVDHVILAGLV